MMHTEGIRDVIRYIRKFKGSTIVIRMDDDVVDSPLFSSHIHDLALLHETGIRIVLIPGAHEHISRVLDSYGIAWKIENTIRITSDEGMNFIKMAAFDVSNRIMTRLSAEGLTAVIGNWVRARGRGVLDGTDFGSAGFVDKIQLDSLLTALEDGFIPIIPCIGWTSTGKPYNISSTELAVATATALKAGKLFFLGSGNTISIDDFTIPESASLSPEGRLAALSVESIDEFLELNRDSGSPTLPVDKLTDLLLQARTACLGGVTRAHILDADIDGVIPAEIFSDLGSGTMIYVNNYGTFRAMTREDIPAVLSLMNPFVEKGILLPRTSEELEQKAHEFVVFEIDGGIRACAALHSYPENVGEIAGLAVDEAYAHMGIGPRLMDLLLQRGKSAGFSSVFVLTTQTGDWFEKFGFKSAETGQLPRERQEKWDPKRRSRVFIKTF
ncbi:MAG TPA: amino-acid N-acetyltransferase [Treponemataceae bacterium]|jgi:amino-acid N-acetyltransferase|nr:amino-acid N-acetyltransferase [Treponema sp.]HOF84711.1 amino-acid N-acetyltransferase [Treponemataceae bacterium]HOS36012.1 amino-acid N-acetyltransferase [Treponemataceae bacterium]HPA09927.1 amino-acid N-acetyltransferase [Treponemataceae bacterium]HQB87877.1 amino-acid N-acetyltransferase [Treponemataceae bacterium]